jgi:hypothetical protein
LILYLNVTAIMPINRNEFLIPLSREHHDGLLLCWKIRIGFKNNIQISRIQAYAEWFYNNHLITHFDVEEKYVFPILGNDHDLVKRALAEHRKLKRLFQSLREEEKNIGLIEEILEGHIRFEERVLFAEIERIASASQLEEIKVKHSDKMNVHYEWEDKFW